ncbi:M24 family metallopeptidase [Aquamicrobium sp. LC103]|uniref:M24 family metallopeptidase n=1 Tax=Aquamicrobium sp. LC103 TaxID=1120658 RepID=UPI00063E6DC6|nr:M24 family metallopeptidase [Aquamicrobium sp. LC103]TKT76142.1 M24 family metallopeptidase [Aquamicrobium sp. LC103]
MPVSYSDRIAGLRARMKVTGTDLVAIGPSSQMVWLAGLSPHGDERPVMLLVTQGYAGFLMPALNVDSSRKHTDLPMFAWSDAEGPQAALDELLKACAIDRSNVGVVLDETMRADFALLLLDALPGARRSFTGETVSFLRARKDQDEYRVLKAGAIINDRAMQAGFEALRPGVTELEVAEAIRDAFKSQGAAPLFTSVCFGANGAFPHHHTGGTALKAGEAVLLDIGGRFQDYSSDMTRVAHSGGPGTAFQRIHGIVEAAVDAALAAARPGAPASAVDKAARDVIAAAGYGDHFVHRTGHGLGLDTHEPPYITATEETVLEEGMVFSIEPGIYLPGKFGMRLEEIVILRKDGPEILSELTRAPFLF